MLDIDSPSMGCSSSSTLTSWQTSVNRDAVRSRIPLWWMIGNTPLGHERAYSTEKCEPQTPVVGKPCGGQPYLRASASLKARLCRSKPNSLRGNVVIYTEAPLSPASFS